jgi:hypothetical protein
MCMCVSSQQIARQNHDIKVANKPLFVADFRFLGMKLTSQNCVLEEVRSRLNLENGCHHLVQNIVSCYFLSNSIKAKITYMEVQFFLLFCMSKKLGISH